MRKRKKAEGSVTPHDLYVTYCDGWSAGAGRKGYAPPARDERRPVYDRAYTEGQKAGRAAKEAYAKEIGYEPVVVKLQGVDDED